MGTKNSVHSVYKQFAPVRWYVCEALGLGEEMDVLSNIWGTSTLCYDDSGQPEGQ